MINSYKFSRKKDGTPESQPHGEWIYYEKNGVEKARFYYENGVKK
jgi:hypothetical protein